MTTENKASVEAGEPGFCSICRRRLDVEGEPLSADTGGDCWGCISAIEAGMLDAPLDEYRLDPARWTNPGEAGSSRSKPPGS